MRITFKYKRWITAIASMAGLTVPLWLLYHSGDAGLAPVTFLFSGSAFDERAILAGGALDQFSLHKELFIFCFSLVVLCPFIAFVRWINGHSPRNVRLIFAILSLIILVHPLSILTIFTYDVSRYVFHMGVTPMRLMGIALAIISYMTMSLFAVWVCGLKMREPMKPDFIPLDGEKPGIITAILRASYADLLKLDPRWESEQVNWDEYDREVFAHPKTVGSCLFLTRSNGRIAGFGSWDPRQRPEYGIVGHNCILPEFRGKGLGRQQIQEILRRFQKLGIKTAKVSTNDHPFFVPAQRMYIACGFREVRRITWDRDPSRKTIEYEKEIGQQTAAGGITTTAEP